MHVWSTRKYRNEIFIVIVFYARTNTQVRGSSFSVFRRAVSATSSDLYSRISQKVMRESTLSSLRWTAQRANERVEDSKLGSIRPWRCYTNTRYIITLILIVRSRQWQHIWTISSRTKMVNPFRTRLRRSFSGERNCVRISTDFLSTRKMHSSLHFPSDWFVVLFSQ